MWLVAAIGIVGSLVLARLVTSSVAKRETLATEKSYALTPDASRMRQIFDINKGMASDPDLAQAYDDLNVQYFDDGLPKNVSIRWDDRLADVGPTIADGFRLEGMTDGRMILINPAIQRDRAEFRRTLCHEMVHVQVWGRDAAHGAAFQQALRAVWERGAFSGLLATDEEKDQLHDVLRRLSERIGAEERDRTPAGVSRVNASLAEYNRLVERYNLMISYPDGLDRERLAQR